jgi:hypothetical protein
MRMLNAIQREIWMVDRSVAMTGTQTITHILRSDNAQPRFSLIVLSLFATAGLTLVAIGVYSVISYAVSRRIHEIVMASDGVDHNGTRQAQADGR